MKLESLNQPPTKSKMNAQSPSETLLKEVLSRVSSLESEVDTLSKTNEELTEENIELKQRIDSMQEQYSALSDSYEALNARASRLNKDMEIVNSRAEALSNISIRIEDNISELKDSISKDQAKLSQRIHACEVEAGLEEWAGKTESVRSSCTLDRWAEVPPTKRAQELPTKTAVRATLCWERFDDWSTTVHRGKIIKSGDLKKYLSAAESGSIAYTQVYRVMELFAEKTPSEYLYVDEPAVGKALVKER